MFFGVSSFGRGLDVHTKPFYVTEKGIELIALKEMNDEVAGDAGLEISPGPIVHWTPIHEVLLSRG